MAYKKKKTAYVMNTLFYCSFFFVIDLNNRNSHPGTFVWYYPDCWHIMRPIYLYFTETVTNLMLITSVVDFEHLNSPIHLSHFL